MKLTILGMNGPYPAAAGATSGYLLTAGGSTIALDLGSGCLSRLTALTAPEELSAICLSHWHFDHCSDLLPLLYRLPAGRTEPLHLYAPVDEGSPVRQTVIQNSSFRVINVAPGDVLTLDGLRIAAFPARHPVPALMYAITDGYGKKLCYTGDTNTVEGLADFARDADLLLADGLFPSAMWDESKPHLSAAHCAQLANDASVRRLVITHLNPAIDPETLLKEARAIRTDSLLARIGDQYEI